VRWSVADDNTTALSTIVHLEMAVLVSKSLPGGEGWPPGGLTSASGLVVERIGNEYARNPKWMMLLEDPVGSKAVEGWECETECCGEGARSRDFFSSKQLACRLLEEEVQK
jgi:hypothetical protein